MRGGDVPTVYDGAEDLALLPRGFLGEDLERGIGIAGEDEFVKHLDAFFFVSSGERFAFFVDATRGDEDVSTALAGFFGVALDLGDFATRFDANVAVFGYFVLPGGVDAREFRESHHGRHAGEQAVFGEFEQAHARIEEDSFEDGRRNVLRVVARTEEERNKRIHHALAKVVREAKHLEHPVHGDDGEQHLKPFNCLERGAELFDILGILLDELRGEDVAPKRFLPFTEGDLHAHFLRFEAKHTLKHFERVVEDGRGTLYAVVDVLRLALGWVRELVRGGRAAQGALLVVEGHVELVRGEREGVAGRHARGAGSDDDDALLVAGMAAVAVRSGRHGAGRGIVLGGVVNGICTMVFERIRQGGVLWWWLDRKQRASDAPVSSRSSDRERQTGKVCHPDEDEELATASVAS